MEQLSKHVPEIDAILGEALKSGHSLDEPYVISRHIAAKYFEMSPYFQQWAKPLGMADVMVFFLMHTPMHLSCFSGGRHERQGIITEREKAWKAANKTGIEASNIIRYSPARKNVANYAA